MSAEPKHNFDEGERRLMEGSEAIAESAIAAGCRFFSGYPMTPFTDCLLYTSPSPRDLSTSRMPSSA